MHRDRSVVDCPTSSRPLGGYPSSLFVAPPGSLVTTVKRPAQPWDVFEDFAASSQSTRHATMIVLSVGLAMRLLVLGIVVRQYPPAWLFQRGLEMGWLAQSILNGQGLSSPFGPLTGPSAFVAPAYPLLIAGVFRIFGSYTFASAIFIMSVQIGLNLVTIWLMMHVARTLFDPLVSLIAGLVWACSLPLIWMPTIFWDTSISICLMVGLLAVVLRLRGRTTTWSWVLLGSYAALIALVNPAMILLSVSMIGWLASQELPDRPWGGLLAALTFCVVFSPWPIRNARVLHAFVPLRSTLSYELWMGNRSGATGYLDQSLFPSFNPDELNDYKARGELGYTAHKADLAKHYILTHPKSTMLLTTLRITRYWLGTGTRGGSPIFAVHAVMTFCFGLLGLSMIYRRQMFDILVLFSLPLLLFPLPYYITHAEFRYRLAVDPLLTILAAYAVATLYRAVRAAEAHPLIPPDCPVHG